jgi:hypothetical protein
VSIRQWLSRSRRANAALLPLDQAPLRQRVSGFAMAGVVASSPDLSTRFCPLIVGFGHLVVLIASIGLDAPQLSRTYHQYAPRNLRKTGLEMCANPSEGPSLTGCQTL